MPAFPLALPAILLCLSASFATAQSPATLAFSGEAVNVSVGVSDKVALVITDKGDNEFAANGTFANGTLFGSFRASGMAQDGCAAGKLCLSFDGVLENLQDGGFDADTVTSLSLTLMFSDDRTKGIGTFRTGILPSYSRDQYGTLTLSAR